MTPLVEEFSDWHGVWTGHGEAQAGMPVLVRNEVFMGVECTALAFHFEAFDPKAETLFHGVRAVLSIAPNGVQRATAYSTIHGALLLDRTQDDDGVLALGGLTANGNLISVTMMLESANEMMFAAFWRPPNVELNDPATPRMTVRLKRIHPWQMPTA